MPPSDSVVDSREQSTSDEISVVWLQFATPDTRQRLMEQSRVLTTKVPDLQVDIGLKGPMSRCRGVRGSALNRCGFRICGGRIRRYQARSARYNESFKWPLAHLIEHRQHIRPSPQVYNGQRRVKTSIKDIHVVRVPRRPSSAVLLSSALRRDAALHSLYSGDAESRPECHGIKLVPPHLYGRCGEGRRQSTFPRPHFRLSLSVPIRSPVRLALLTRRRLGVQITPLGLPLPISSDYVFWVGSLICKSRRFLTTKTPRPHCTSSRSHASVALSLDAQSSLPWTHRTRAPPSSTDERSNRVISLSRLVHVLPAFNVASTHTSLSLSSPLLQFAFTSSRPPAPARLGSGRKVQVGAGRCDWRRGMPAAGRYRWDGGGVRMVVAELEEVLEVGNEEVLLVREVEWRSSWLKRSRGVGSALGGVCRMRVGGGGVERKEEEVDQAVIGVSTIPGQASGSYARALSSAGMKGCPVGGGRGYVDVVGNVEGEEGEAMKDENAAVWRRELERGRHGGWAAADGARCGREIGEGVDPHLGWHGGHQAGRLFRRARAGFAELLATNVALNEEGLEVVDACCVRHSLGLSLRRFGRRLSLLNYHIDWPPVPHFSASSAPSWAVSTFSASSSPISTR
ncbi:hypothetical protein R3P38DRAFT_2795430 [Favolaschia claudopus]|uniref:Uncharacterized protein n=1 Tax=Favolaschia claudopus TaxID=2862362 RepID=A0AAW0A7R3_9AGAR